MTPNERAEAALKWVQSEEGINAINRGQVRAAETARKFRLAIGRPLRGDRLPAAVQGERGDAGAEETK